MTAMASARAILGERFVRGAKCELLSDDLHADAHRDLAQVHKAAHAAEAARPKCRRRGLLL
jgi:hypothetical protein